MTKDYSPKEALESRYGIYQRAHLYFKELKTHINTTLHVIKTLSLEFQSERDFKGYRAPTFQLRIIESALLRLEKLIS